MSRTERRHEDRALAFEAHHIRVAAAAEALALGHPEVDVEHLLLGLLVVGGPSARALTDAGADLHGVRRAMAEVTEHDLRTLGISAPAQHAAVHTDDRIAALAVPVSGRVRDLLENASSRGDDRGLLLALLDDEGRRARRLLEHLGVDVEALRGLLDREPAAAAAPEDSGEQDHAALRGPAPAGGSWLEASHSHVLPVPVDRVWALVSDPSRRTQWDHTATAVVVTAEGLEDLTPRGGGAASQRVVRYEPGLAIAWRRRGAGTAEVPAAATDQVLQLVLQPSGGTTRVHLRHSTPGRGRAVGSRLSRFLLVRMLRAQLRLQAQGIAQAA